MVVWRGRDDAGEEVKWLDGCEEERRVIEYQEKDMRRVHCNENPIYVFLFWELHGLTPNIHIHKSVRDLNIPRIGPLIWLQQNRQTDRWKYINLSQKYECRN
jgi:hypothetical protein